MTRALVELCIAVVSASAVFVTVKLALDRFARAMCERRARKNSKQKEGNDD